MQLHIARKIDRNIRGLRDENATLAERANTLAGERLMLMARLKEISRLTREEKNRIAHRSETAIFLEEVLELAEKDL